MRLGALKEGEDEVAHALGLKGCTRAGWQCPSCHAPNALAERAEVLAAGAVGVELLAGGGRGYGAHDHHQHEQEDRPGGKAGHRES